MAKPTAERYAALRPAQPMRRAANSSNEYTTQDTSATKIFGSSIDIAGTWASSANTKPATSPIVRNTQPTTMARWFIWSSTCRHGDLSDLHRPHADDERVRQCRRREHRRRQTRGNGRAPREVEAVTDERADVEDQRDDVHRVGPKYPSFVRAATPGRPTCTTIRR